MRLTFRRLLAYLDGVLDEQDAEVVGQKVQESDFATRLIHRIRNAKTRLRLGAPRLSGRGMGLDPNTVAEYLDFTLDEQRVPDFEKVCLESDVHLAEVASAHEVLTLVLAEPAQVERSIRERIYGLPEEAKQKTAAPVAAAPLRSDPGQPPAGPPEKSLEEASAMREVSEMLHTRDEVRWRSMLLTMGLSFLLVLVGLRALGPFDNTHPVIGSLLGGGEVARGSGDASAPAIRQDDLSSPTVDPDAPATRVADVIIPNGSPAAAGPPPGVSGDDGADAGTVGAGDAGEDAGPPQPEPVGPVPAAEPGIPPLPPADPSAPPAPPIEDGPPPPVESGGPPAPAAEPGAPPAPAPEPGAPPAPDTELASPLPPIPDPLTTPPAQPADPLAPPAAGPVEVGIDVGRYTSEHSLLTRYNQEEDSWRPLPSRDVIRSGDRLMAPPAFRPQLALASGIQLIVVGPAELLVLAPRDDAPAVSLEHGRMMVEGVATAGAQLHLELAGMPGTIVLKTADTSVAVEVERFTPVGADPKDGSQPAVRWAVLRGEAQWIAEDGSTSDLSLGESIVAIDGKVMAPSAAPTPKWAFPDLEGIAKLDFQNANAELQPQFKPELAASLTFQELLEHRMADVRSLASRSLTHMNEFGPFVRSLGDEDSRRYWSKGFSAMRESLSRGPEAAEQLREALIAEYPGENELTDRLYQLCLSFDNEQLAAGEAAKLVEDLSHQQMAIRVLAWENLRRITGKTHLYFPEKPPAQQRTSLQAWKRSLDDGEIHWEKLPEPFAAGA